MHLQVGPCTQILKHQPEVLSNSLTAHIQSAHTFDAEDQESKQVHLNGVVVRDLSSAVSNYRSKSNLSDYLKKQNVRGIANVDTRAITRRLRESGNLNGIITSDSSKSDEELIEQAKSWSIVGKDLISDISTKEPYEWKDPTVDEFSQAVKAQNGATEPLHVSSPTQVAFL